ncbi:MAG TPA: EAL domain-containing protein [Baekduia sp.]|uniref:EAL domain-containing protein n=1 Tax=Baekduia sp. TaxID=2600305 RepID=UPI002D7A2BCC|nr:EAL domain-containing protein [Baekduia sp.]HET6510288.1 EAL domain-containing protein [Baekduia sp.]
MPLTTLSTAASALAQLGDVHAHFQPIVDLTTGRAVAYEALARFSSGSRPDVAFALAREHGVGPELEAAALDAAFRDRDGGDDPDVPISVNVSASALDHPDVRRALPRDLSNVIVEITENELVTTESAIAESLAALRARGARVAVDDAGAGYASLRQVLALAPDIIKLDRTLVAGVDRDPAKAALVRALVALGRDLDARVCAEGIEELGELLALADLDVALGQGFHLAPPGPGRPAVDPLAATAARYSQSAALRPADPLGMDIDAVAQALADATTDDDFEDAIAGLQGLLGVDDVYVSRVVEGDDGPMVLATAGRLWREEPVHRLADFPATAAALDTGEAVQVLVGDHLDDPSERALMERQGFGSMLMVPLRCRGRAVGILEIYRHERHAWSRRHIVRARTVAAPLALALARVDDPPRH